MTPRGAQLVDLFRDPHQLQRDRSLRTANFTVTDIARHAGDVAGECISFGAYRRG
jgi:hypothetical protein